MANIDRCRSTPSRAVKEADAAASAPAVDGALKEATESKQATAKELHTLRCARLTRVDTCPYIATAKAAENAAERPLEQAVAPAATATEAITTNQHTAVVAAPAAVAATASTTVADREKAELKSKLARAACCSCTRTAPR